MINIKNYFQKVAGVAFDSAPDAIFEGHTFVTKLSKNGQDWTAYEQSDYIKQTVDIYFEKLEQFLKPGKLIQLPVKKLVKPKRKGKSTSQVVTARKVAEGKKPLSVSVKKSAELADIEKFLRMDKRESSYGSILILSRTISKRLKESTYKSHLDLLQDISNRLKKLVTTLESDKVQKFKVNIDLDLQDRCTKAIESATVVMRTDYLAGASKNLAGIPEEIRSQIGKRALFMLGAKDLYSIENGNGLSFRIRGSKKFTHIQIVLNSMDTYDMTFYKVVGDQIKNEETVKGIYNDQLHDIIESKTGLYTSLGGTKAKKKSPLQKKSKRPLDGIDFAIEAKANQFPVATKSVKPVIDKKNGLCEVKPDSLFKPISNIETKETFMLKGDLGKFLGNLEKYQLSMTLEGDQGAGKTQFSFQLANAFAEAGYDVGFFSLEVGANSDIIKRNRDKYLSPIGLKKVLIAGEAPRGIDTIREYAKKFGVVIIDSFTKLNCDSKEFDRLRKEFPETIWIIIFQRTSSGQIRGGTQPLFDAGINIEVVKADESFVNNYAVATKNRYGMTGLRFNISQSKIIE